MNDNLFFSDDSFSVNRERDQQSPKDKQSFVLKTNATTWSQGLEDAGVSISGVLPRRPSRLRATRGSPTDRSIFPEGGRANSLFPVTAGKHCGPPEVPSELLKQLSLNYYFKTEQSLRRTSSKRRVVPAHIQALTRVPANTLPFTASFPSKNEGNVCANRAPFSDGSPPLEDTHHCPKGQVGSGCLRRETFGPLGLLSSKSKNILTLVFSIFLSNSGRSRARLAAPREFTQSAGTSTASSQFQRKHREDSTSGAHKEPRSTPVGSAPRNRSGVGFMKEPNRMQFYSKFIRLFPSGLSKLTFANTLARKRHKPEKSKIQVLPFFILVYIIIVGFQGSTTQFFSHEKRILAQKPNKSEAETSLVRGAAEGRNPRLGNYLRSGLEGLRIGDYAPSNRATPYSPFEKVSKFNRESTLTQLDTLPIACRIPHIERYGLQLTHLFVQIFVFWVLQKFISENASGFGRNNPLRQKDQKNTQARILWPKKEKLNLLRVLRAFSQRVKNSGNPTEPISETLNLPGIQEVSTLIQVLIESLKRKSTRPRQTKWSSASPVSARLESVAYPGGSGGIPSNTSLREETLIPLQNFVPPKGYLFVGPPGTGKTLLAQEIAQLAKVPFICVSASEIQKQIEIGTRIGALRLRKLFDQARHLSPCILFFDEIDAIAQRQQQHDSKLFTEFLVQMDSWGLDARSGTQEDRKTKGLGWGSPPSWIGRESARPGYPEVSGRSGAQGLSPSLTKGQISARIFGQSVAQKPAHSVILGTTNYLSKLDSAFVRAGRFDRILALSYPSKKIRFDILKFYIEGARPSLPSPGRHVNVISGGSPSAERSLLSGPNTLFSNSKVFLGSTLGLNYFAFATDGFSQAHLARLVNESLLFSISKKETSGNGVTLGREETASSNSSVSRTLFSQLSNESKSRFAKTSFLSQPLSKNMHSFESLLQGLKKMQIHQTNLPSIESRER